MKKGKITGDVAVMEIPQTNSLGVRTRARTLALQPNPELSYLQLRNRRLEKPPFQPPPPPSPNTKSKHQNSYKNNDSDNHKPSSKVRVNSVNSATSGASNKSQGRVRHFTVAESEDFHDLASLEPSFGENNLEFDARERFDFYLFFLSILYIFIFCFSISVQFLVWNFISSIFLALVYGFFCYLLCGCLFKQVFFISRKSPKKLL